MNVYLSSTLRDLEAERNAVKEVLGDQCVVKHSYRAHEGDLVGSCLQDVAGCDLYIGILGLRYGFVPPGQDVSITQLEYEAARNKPRLLFIKDESSIPFTSTDAGTEEHPVARIKEFRRQVASGQEGQPRPAVFKTADELKLAVQKAVSAFRERVAPVPRKGPSTVLDVPAYTRKVVERYGRVELDALVPPERDEQLRIPLDAIFIEQLVREDRPPVELPKEMWGQLEKEGAVDARELPGHPGAQQLERARSAYRERPAEPVFDVLGRSAAARVVLLGDPGAGKSALTRYVLLSLLTGQGDPRVRAAYPGSLPFLVELRKFAGLRAEGRCESFLDYFDLLGRTEGFSLARESVDAWLRGPQPALMVFDGLDELFDPLLHETVTHQIAGFATDYPGTRILVTSRLVGYSPKILTDAGFLHFTLQDFEPPQITRFLAAWFVRALGDRPEDAAVRQQRILAAVEDSPSIRQLAGNPMLLTIMAIIGKNQELPRERTELYQHAASVLVEHWDVRKHLKGMNLDTGHIDRHEKFELLRRVAWAMQAAPGGLAGNYIPDERLSEVIEGYLRDRFTEPPARARLIGFEMVRQLRERNFILCLYGAGLYGFVHRSFLEFFCATAIQHGFEKTRELSLEQLHQRIYAAHSDQPEWREILRLVAGLIEPQFAGEVAAHLANPLRGAGSSHEQEADLRRLALAIECFAEIRNLRPLQDVGERLLRAVCSLLKVTDSAAYAVRMVLQYEIVPAVERIGERWPGREALKDWFLRQESSVSSNELALRLMAALYRSEPATLELLTGLSSSGDAFVRRCAVRVLGRRFRQTPQVADLLVRLSRDDMASEVRYACLSRLVSGFQGHPGLPELLIERATEDPDETSRSRALWGMVTRYREDPRASALLRDRLAHDHDEEVRRVAVSLLTSAAGVEVFDLLVDRMRNDPHHVVRIAALSELMRLVDRQPELQDLLLEAVERDPDGEVRANALSGLLTAFRDRPRVFELGLDRARNDPEGGARGAALSALVSAYRERPEVFALLRERLQEDGSLVVRSAAVEELAAAFPDRPETTDLLIERVERDAEPVLRGEALSALAAGGDRPEVLALARRKARNDEDAGVRGIAAAAILQVRGSDDERLLKILSQDLDGREPYHDPWQPMSFGHLAHAREFLALDEPSLTALVDKLTALLGWDPRYGMP